MAQHLSGPASLTGQVALITGGSGGMGRRSQTRSRRPVRAWWPLTSVNTPTSDPGIDYRQYDVTSRAQTDKVIDHVLAEHGKVDILVLCAGIIARTPLAQSTDEDRIDAVGKRFWCRQSDSQTISDHVRARLRQNPCLRFDRREERRSRLRSGLRGLEGCRTRDDALDGQSGRAARRVCQCPGSRPGRDRHVGQCDRQPGSRGKLDRAIGSLWQR